MSLLAVVVSFAALLLAIRAEMRSKPTAKVLESAALVDQFALCQQGQESAIVALSARVRALEEKARG